MIDHEPLKSSRLALLITFIIALGSGELMLRFADHFGLVNIWSDIRKGQTDSVWEGSTDPVLLFKNRPNYISNGIRYTEANGIHRPDDVSRHGLADTYRIAVIGDSVAAALKLTYEERAFSLVEKALNRTGSQAVEVLNFSVSGYSTRQQERLLHTFVKEFQPDHLVLQHCVNDFYPSEYPAWLYGEHSPSYLLTFLHYIYTRLFINIGYPEADYWENLYRTDTQGWNGMEQAMQSIADYAIDMNIPLSLVIFPVMSIEGWLAGDAQARHQRIGKLARQQGYAVLDLLPVLGQYPVDELRRAPYDTFHLNAQGHRIAADAILQELFPDRGSL